MLKSKFLYFTIAGIIFAGCAGVKNSSNYPESLPALIAGTSTFQENHFGFALYDPGKRTTLHQVNSHKYFTPASNTKLYTFYASLLTLQDSLRAINYKINGDSLIIWGTGDPTFLNPDFPQNPALLNLLGEFDGEIYYSDIHFTNHRYGPGWAWDDYLYGYMPEMTAMPIYGNQVQIMIDSVGNFNVTPSLFRDSISFDMPDLNFNNKYFREENNNRIFLDLDYLNELKAEKRNIPIRFSPHLFLELLADTLGRDINYVQIPFDSLSKSIKSIPTDTVLRKMMQDSDNFLAEQLLLQATLINTNQLNTAKGIAFMQEKHLEDFPDKPIWKDGSGLSRYNLFTPASMIYLLDKLYRLLPQHRLFNLLPSGGLNGTIENWYKGMDGPYIFAKTGTLTNNHCLSGYIKVKSGKVLIFSFMHNNYPYSSSLTKQAMQPVLEYIRDNY